MRVAGAALVLDTSGWLLALSGAPAYAEALEQATRAYVPGLVLAEVDHHLRARRREMHRLLAELDAGDVYELVPPTLADLSRAVAIDRKFATLKLGLVDASIVATAERLGVFRVLTADADFVAVRAGPRFDRHLELPVIPPRRSR